MQAAIHRPKRLRKRLGVTPSSRLKTTDRYSVCSNPVRSAMSASVRFVLIFSPAALSIFEGAITMAVAKLSCSHIVSL